MYTFGEGVTRYYVRAHVWFNVAVAAGDADAVDGRDLAARKLSAQQISEAQKLARECLASNYEDCGEPHEATLKAPRPK